MQPISKARINLDTVKQCMHYLIKEHFLFLTPNGNQLLTLLRELLTLENFCVDLLSTEQTIKQLNCNTVNTSENAEIRTFLKRIVPIPPLVWMQILNSYTEILLNFSFRFADLVQAHTKRGGSELSSHACLEVQHWCWACVQKPDIQPNTNILSAITHFLAI